MPLNLRDILRTSRTLVLGTILISQAGVRPEMFGAAAITPAMAAAVKEELPPGTKIAALEVTPAKLVLDGCFDGAQLLVTAKFASGETMDVTRLAAFAIDPKVGAVSPSGQVVPIGNGRTSLVVKLAGKTATVPLEVVRFDPNQKVDFIRDVNPVIAQLGCSAGSCHGA